jgi:hypothetical protein
LTTNPPARANDIAYVVGLPTWACAQTIFRRDRRRAQPARRESDRHILMTGVYSNAGFDLTRDSATGTLAQFLNPYYQSVMNII